MNIYKIIYINFTAEMMIAVADIWKCATRNECVFVSMFVQIARASLISISALAVTIFVWLKCIICVCVFVLRVYFKCRSGWQRYLSKKDVIIWKKERNNMETFILQIHIETQVFFLSIHWIDVHRREERPNKIGSECVCVCCIHTV